MLFGGNGDVRPSSLPLLLALVAYLPVSGLITLNATVAEHWLYLPSAFLFLAAATAFDSLGEHSFRPQTRNCLPNDLVAGPARPDFCAHFRLERSAHFLTRTIAAGGDSARMWINLGWTGIERRTISTPRAKRSIAHCKGTE